MGVIHIQNMEFYAYHGCFSEEQQVGNRFLVDVKIEADLNEAAKTDNLKKTVDYQEVFRIVEAEMKLKSALIEHVANRILSSVQKCFPEVIHTEVTVSKLHPSLGGKTEKVSVCLRG